MSDEDPVVLLTSVPTAFEADVVIALLRSNDIRATTSGGKGYAYFHRADCPIFVLEHDLERARDILASRPEPFPDG
ncbi:MAG: hypothetical protein JOZ99_14090 [Actinobacteria bacterium]|nr:hypothetical protein [Actinomycetota bacterium]